MTDIDKIRAGGNLGVEKVETIGEARGAGAFVAYLVGSVLWTLVVGWLLFELTNTPSLATAGAAALALWCLGFNITVVVAWALKDAFRCSPKPSTRRPRGGSEG